MSRRISTHIQRKEYLQFEKKARALFCTGIVAGALALFLLPINLVVVTTPMTGPNRACLDFPQPGNSIACESFDIPFGGYSSLSYCLLGSGGLWLNGQYYAWTHPSDSIGVEVNSHCPALGR